jgi:hypothetical protein
VLDPVLVLNVLQGLNSTYDHLRTWITRQRPFPSFLQVRDGLVLEEISRGPRPDPPPPPRSWLHHRLPPLACHLSPWCSSPRAERGGGDVVVLLLVALLVVVVPVVMLVGVVGARRHQLRLLLLPLPLEVRPDHPSAIHGQVASRCGHFRVRGARPQLQPAAIFTSAALLFCAVLDSTRLAQSAFDLAWGVGLRRDGAVLQHHGADTAGQHQVDR